MPYLLQVFDKSGAAMLAGDQTIMADVNWVDLGSFSMGASANSSGTGGGTQKKVVTDCYFTCAVASQASVQIFNATANGDQFARGIIDAFKSEGDWYLRYEFKDVFFKSASLKPRRDVEPAQMDASLNFEHATLTYYHTGGDDVTPVNGWDIQPTYAVPAKP